MTKAVFRLLLGLSLVSLPILVVGGLRGSFPEPLRKVLLVLFLISSAAMIVLTIWALCLIYRDDQLPPTEKQVWGAFVFFTGFIGASVYLARHLRRDAGGPT